MFLPWFLMAAAGAGGGGGIVTLSGESISNVITGNAALHIETDGKVYKTDFSGKVQIDAATDWIKPNGEADSTYDVRYTNLVGDALTAAPAAEDSWIDLSSNRVWSQSSGSSTFDIEIRKDGGATLASAEYTLLGASA